MLEWVCPSCDRAVDPALKVCPFCAHQETRASSKQRTQPSFWSDVERGFRVGLGFVSVLALVYFLLFILAYLQDNDLWLARLARWIHLR